MLLKYIESIFVTCIIELDKERNECVKKSYNITISQSLYRTTS